MTISLDRPLAILALTATLIGSLALGPVSTRAQAIPRTAPAPAPVISRGVPAFASGGDPAGLANDADYATQWRSDRLPAWLAYDLAGLPPARRGRAVVAWYNADATQYDTTILRRSANALPRAYTVEANPAPSGPVAPSLGWVTLASVTGNTYHSRQHVVALAGHNWVRVVVTDSIGRDEVRLNLDVHDTGWGVEDSWIFYGDSITAAGLHAAPIGATGTFAQLVNARLPTSFPVQESGGIDSLTSDDGARLIPAWLATYPGRYVGLSYGTNDSLLGTPPDAFYAYYEAMVRAVLAAGKIPIVPKIPWSVRTAIHENAPALNARLDQLYVAYPEIIPGPDFWTYFREHPDLLSSDAVHPTDEGYAAYRQLWADTMLQRVYGGAK